MYGLGGRGVGGHIFEHRAGNWTTHWTEHYTGVNSLFQIRIVALVVPLHKGWDPIGACIALLVTGNIFLHFPSVLQPLCLHFQGFSEHNPHAPPSGTLSRQKSAPTHKTHRVGTIGDKPREIYKENLPYTNSNSSKLEKVHVSRQI